MASTYEILKTHFDNLMLNGYPKSNHLEPIRDSYEIMFNKPINHFDIYSTRISSPHNPIKVIYSLIGDDSYIDGIPDGIIPCGDHIVCTSVQSTEIFKPQADKGALDRYINNVYHTMKSIIKMDRLYPSDSMARTHAYLAYLKSCPFYFTYHHFAKCWPGVDAFDVFTKLLEKYIISGEEVYSVYKSVASSRYNPNPEVIYATMSCHGSVELFS